MYSRLQRSFKYAHEIIVFFSLVFPCLCYLWLSAWHVKLVSSQPLSYLFHVPQCINLTNGFLSKREGMLAMFTTGWVELFLSYGYAGFAKGTERDVGFQFLYVPQAGRNEPIVHIAVLGFMNSNGYVSSQVLSHVPIITRLHVCKYHKIICVRSWSLTSMILCSRLLILVYQINK